MLIFEKKRALSQPHCHECHKALERYAEMRGPNTDNSMWEGVKAIATIIFLCPDHPQKKYEQEGYDFVGNFEWELGMPEMRRA